jgi:hypothetical protein
MEDGQGVFVRAASSFLSHCASELARHFSLTATLLPFPIQIYISFLRAVLLNLSPGDEEVETAAIAGFVAPADYGRVWTILSELGAYKAFFVRV